MSPARRLYAVLAASAMALAAGLVAAPLSVAESKTVTVAGSLQSELGCPDDWQPDCAATDLAHVGTTTYYARASTVPAGTYEFKVTINDSWDENYGAGGVANGAEHRRCRCRARRTLGFAYDDTTHQVGRRPRPTCPTARPPRTTAMRRRLAAHTA